MNRIFATANEGTPGMFSWLSSFSWSVGWDKSASLKVISTGNLIVSLDCHKSWPRVPISLWPRLLLVIQHLDASI
jgi:hypothetical protein